MEVPPALSLGMNVSVVLVPLEGEFIFALIQLLHVPLIDMLIRAELCGVVESMFSLSYLYKSVGDKAFADRCELAAFNALPVMTTPDFWAHQYVAQTNQPYSMPLPESPFFNVNNRGQTYGLEPHFVSAITSRTSGANSRSRGSHAAP